MCCVIAPSKFQKYTVLLIVVIWRGVNKSTVKTLFLYKKRKKKSKANNVIELVLDLWVYHGIDMITQRSARNYGHSCPQSNLCSTFILNIPNDVLLAMFHWPLISKFGATAFVFAPLQFKWVSVSSIHYTYLLRNCHWSLNKSGISTWLALFVLSIFCENCECV